MSGTWSIRPHRGAPVPERLSREEQRAVRKATGVVPQRPGVPGPVVTDPSGRTVLAISAFSAVRPDPDGRGLLSTAEVLRPPALEGESWPAGGQVEHQGIGWTTWSYADLDGVTVGEGRSVTGRDTGWGGFAGATVRSGTRTWTLDDVVRPETEAERARRERRRFFRRERLAGRVLGHRFVAADGTESGRLTWVGDHQPDHHERPYEWRLEWGDDPVDDGVLVGAVASALRFMAHVGTMLSTS